MIGVVDLAGTCERLLANMRDITGPNYAFDLTRPNGTLDFLFSPMGGGARADLSSVQEGRKYRTVRVHYKKRFNRCDLAHDAAVGDICDTPAEPAESSTTIEITKRIGLAQPLKFSNDKMINICENTQGFINEYLLAAMKNLREGVNDASLALIDAGAGRNHAYDGQEYSEITNKSLELLTTTGGIQTPNFANFADIDLDFRHNQMLGTAGLIGEGILSKFMTLMNFSCCNAPGVAYDAAIAKVGNAFFLDHGANRVLGANEFLVVAPGTVSLLWFNRYRNVNIQSPILSHFVIPDPVYPGLAWDATFEWSKCDEAWLFHLKADYDIFTPPTDQFGSEDLSSPTCEDDLVGTTGIFHYRATAG